MSRLDFEPKWLLTFTLFLTGLFIGALALFLVLNNKRSPVIEKIHPSRYHYRFTNPLLAVDIASKKEFLQNSAEETKIRKIIDQAQSRGDITKAAVYFRDLEPGRWVGVNQDLYFSPGKLLKVPLMIAYLKRAESDSTVLSDKLTNDINTGNSNNIQQGKSYTVDELISLMFIKDNNIAAELLFKNIDVSSLDDIYSDLGINFKEDDPLTDDFITIKQYSLLFRILYNATYLNRDMSEKALEILAKNPTNDGLVRSIGQGINVAHRYRIRQIDGNNGPMFESHTCGLIYYPDHPYLLCMMDIGSDTSKLDGLFQEISSFVYQNFESAYKSGGEF